MLRPYILQPPPGSIIANNPHEKARVLGQLELIAAKLDRPVALDTVPPEIRHLIEIDLDAGGGPGPPPRDAESRRRTTQTS